MMVAMSACSSPKQSIKESIFGVKDLAFVFIMVNSFFLFRSFSSSVRARSIGPSSSSPAEPSTDPRLLLLWISYGFRPTGTALAPDAEEGPGAGPEVAAARPSDLTVSAIISSESSDGLCLRAGSLLPAIRAWSGLILCQSWSLIWISRTSPRVGSSNLRLRFMPGLAVLIL